MLQSDVTCFPFCTCEPLSIGPRTVQARCTRSPLWHEASRLTPLPHPRTPRTLEKPSHGNCGAGSIYTHATQFCAPCNATRACRTALEGARDELRYASRTRRKNPDSRSRSWAASATGYADATSSATSVAEPTLTSAGERERLRGTNIKETFDSRKKRE